MRSPLFKCLVSGIGLPRRNAAVVQAAPEMATFQGAPFGTLEARASGRGILETLTPYSPGALLRTHCKSGVAAPR
jgi:hypothetical protein